MARKFKSADAQRKYYARKEHYDRTGSWPAKQSSLSKAQNAPEKGQDAPLTTPRNYQEPLFETPEPPAKRRPTAAENFNMYF